MLQYKSQIQEFILNISSKSMRLQDKIIVGFVWWLIFFEALSFLYLFATNFYTHNQFLFIAQIPIFVVVVSILCVSYFRSTLQSPGNPNYLTNINYGEQIEEIKIYARKQSQQKKKRRRNRKRNQIDFQQIQSLNKVSYCFKCDVVKQKRVHHCSVCNKCVIRMDHHCPWVGNCVGKYNQKFFILFLFYATTGLLTVAVSITIDYFTGSYYAQLLTETQTIWLYIVCVSSYMLALSIGFLFVTQMMTAVQNITTLQSFTNGIKQSNPWHRQSVQENLKQIFGESNWAIPTNPFPNCPKYTTSSLQQVVDL